MGVLMRLAKGPMATLSSSQAGAPSWLRWPHHLAEPHWELPALGSL